MIVDAKGIHFLSAREKLDYARREYLTDDLADVENDRLRTYYLTNRLRTAARLLAEACNHLRIAATK